MLNFLPALYFIDATLHDSIVFIFFQYSFYKDGMVLYYILHSDVLIKQMSS